MLTLGPSLATYRHFTKWLALAICAAVAGHLFHTFAIPAGLFLGPLLVAISFGVCGMGLTLHRYVFRFGQGCIGLLVAHSVTWSMLGTLAQSWPIMLAATVVTMGLSTIVGLASVRFGGLSGSTAAWGTAPGAASAMVSMAEEYGADSRVVASMQYVRVICVVMLGSLVSHLLGATDLAQANINVSSLPTAPGLVQLIISLSVIVVGMMMGSKLPAGSLLMPLLLGSTLQLSDVSSVTLPDWLLAFAYGVIGCYVGLRFDQPTLRYVWKLLPAMILSALGLIVLCAACAWLLAHVLERDFLSMYLATSPGGMDIMAIIAIETHADVSFVLAMQTLRLFGVILAGAYCAKQIIRLTQA
ncbi:AbrB family transcriptional regulator [Pseudomonas fulva]|uniref:AbrB family transcriptional regulator n=1 Tax=Pseudomonas fulva TaxID=47880 RepID=UPI003810BDF4